MRDNINKYVSKSEEERQRITVTKRCLVAGGKIYSIIQTKTQFDDKAAIEMESLRDIKELERAITGQIFQINEQFTATGSASKVVVKNTLENLRSILEYCAVDIRMALERVTEVKRVEKVYFPNCESDSRFKRATRENYPGLETHLSEIYELVRSIQPFAGQDDWLFLLCDLTNQAKHNNLIETDGKREVIIRQGRVNLIKADAGSQIIMKGNTVNGVRQDDISVDRQGNIEIGRISGQTEIEK